MGGFLSGRPLGAALIAVYSGFLGVNHLVKDVVLPLLLSDATFSPNSASALWGVLLLAAGYGLWRARRWGLNLTRGLYALSIPLNAISVFTAPDGAPREWLAMFAAVGGAIALAILWYLFTPQVKRFFEKK